MDPCTIPDGVGRGGEDGRKGRRVRDTGGEGPEGAQREQVSTTDENEGKCLIIATKGERELSGAHLDLREPRPGS
jgi:hypothetical protein